jgi:hypothetical protein
MLDFEYHFPKVVGALGFKFLVYNLVFLGKIWQRPLLGADG